MPATISNMNTSDLYIDIDQSNSTDQKQQENMNAIAYSIVNEWISNYKASGNNIKGFEKTEAEQTETVIAPTSACNTETAAKQQPSVEELKASNDISPYKIGIFNTSLINRSASYKRYYSNYRRSNHRSRMDIIHQMKKEHEYLLSAAPPIETSYDYANEYIAQFNKKRLHSQAERKTDFNYDNFIESYLRDAAHIDNENKIESAAIIKTNDETDDVFASYVLFWRYLSSINQNQPTV